MSRNVRTTYQHFPQPYFDILERLDRGEETRIGPMPRRDAKSAAMDLYRFAGLLREAYSTDQRARFYSDIATNWHITVHRAPDTDPARLPNSTYNHDDPHYLVIGINPIVALLEAGP